MFDKTMTISYGIDLALPFLSIIGFVLVLVVRRKFIPVILTTIAFWLYLQLYYSCDPIAFTPACILELDKDSWLVGRAVFVLLHLITLVLYLVFNRKALFFISYGMMLILAADYIHYSGVDLITGVVLTIKSLIFPKGFNVEFFILAMPMFSTIGLMLALATRQKYRWWILSAIMYWVGLGFYYSICPIAIYVSPLSVINGDYWLVTREIIFLSQLVLMILYMILDKKYFFWIAYVIMLVLIIEQLYSYFWGDYFGP